MKLVIVAWLLLFGALLVYLSNGMLHPVLMLH